MVKVQVDPDFVWRQSEPRYFVARLSNRSWGASDGFRFRIELLDDEGRGGAIVVFSENSEQLTILGHTIPAPVVAAAERQQVGSGEYVTSTGEVASPFSGAAAADFGPPLVTITSRSWRGPKPLSWER